MSPTPTDPHLTAYLADRDAPCPSCGYNLRGLTSSRCPECDRELVMELRLAEPRLGPWLAAVVGASVMAGFHTLIALFFLWMVIAMRSFGPRLEQAWPLFICSPVGLGLVVVLVRSRRAYTALSRSTGGVLAIVIWVVALGSALLFFVVSR